MAGELTPRRSLLRLFSPAAEARHSAPDGIAHGDAVR
jgi:hypothetical protein